MRDLRRRGDRDTAKWLEAHERWTYDIVHRVQSLRRLICLCSACHLTTHLGYATVTDRAEQALAHLRAVTGMTHDQVDRHNGAEAGCAVVECRPHVCHPLAPATIRRIRFVRGAGGRRALGVDHQ